MIDKLFLLQIEFRLNHSQEQKQKITLGDKLAIQGVVAHGNIHQHPISLVTTKFNPKEKKVT